jgi:uncharacterized protein
MKVIIAGGTGQVGTILSRAFHAAGHEVVVLSRTPRSAPWRVLQWDAETLGNWTAEIEGSDVVINLAGRSVNCRYHTRNRCLIRDSRLKSTHAIGQAIAQAAQPPGLWLQASTATIYSHRYDKANNEVDGVLGGAEPNLPDTWSFSIGVAKAWEQAALAGRTPRTRQVLMRSAIVMSPDHGGAFDMLLRLTRFGLGGRAGDGRQYVSWIHDEDFIRAVFWLIEHPDISGPINLCAPHPITNSEFMANLRRAWSANIGLPAAQWMIEIGAFFLRTESELILKSRRVVPRDLLASGFTFRFPEWKEAANDLCSRVRNTHN